MGIIQTYSVGIKSEEKMCFIDANILVAMSKFYYSGMYNSPDFTNEIINFILYSRNIGINCDYAIIELCYDYNTNTINSEMLNAFMLAFDNLVMNFSPTEFVNHKGNNKSSFIRKSKQLCKFKSVFECNLPKYLFNDEMSSLNAFYEIYLYFLKLHLLYFSNIPPFEKLKMYFEYMVNEIDLFLGFEFFIGVMLLIGNNIQYEVASQILKPSKSTNIMKFLNPIIDIMNYRRACLLVNCSLINKNPIQAYFSTSDKGLQCYIELCKTYNSIISENTITPVIYFSTEIKSKYLDKWDEFYEMQYYPTLLERNIKNHVSKQTKQEQDTRINKTKDQILILEKQIF